MADSYTPQGSGTSPSTAGKTPLLQLRGITKAYGAVQAVNPNIIRVFRDFGEAACETLAFLDRFRLTMILKRVDIIF